LVVLCDVIAGDGLGRVAALANAGERLDHHDVEHLPGAIGASAHQHLMPDAGDVPVAERRGVAAEPMIRRPVCGLAEL
jgi:hypothetical protein